MLSYSSSEDDVAPYSQDQWIEFSLPDKFCASCEVVLVYAKVYLDADRKDKVVFAPLLVSQIQDTEKDLQGTIRFLHGKVLMCLI